MNIKKKSGDENSTSSGHEITTSMPKSRSDEELSVSSYKRWSGSKYTNRFHWNFAETAERERREALLRKNQEREDKITAKRRAQAQASQVSFAFGSSTPRMGYPQTPGTPSGSGPGVPGTSPGKGDSTNELWNSTRRSTSSSNVHGQLMTQSMYSQRHSAEREAGHNQVDGTLSKSKRATSAHGLNEGNLTISQFDWDLCCLYRFF